MLKINNNIPFEVRFKQQIELLQDHVSYSKISEWAQDKIYTHIGDGLLPIIAHSAMEKINNMSFEQLIEFANSIEGNNEKR